jgi:hypothetical protein
MEQLSFFAEAGQSKGLPKELLEYRPGLFDQAESDELLHQFITEAPWKQSDHTPAYCLVRRPWHRLFCCGGSVKSGILDT